MAGSSIKRCASAVERAASLILLAALVVFFGFMAFRGAYYPPQSAAVVEKTSKQSQDPGTNGAVSESELLPQEVPGVEWVREGDIEVYPEERLYEKIDGAAWRYKLYGNRRLIFGSYVPGPESEVSGMEFRVDAFLYEMDTPLSALGIFGKERPPNVSLVQEFGEAGYLVRGSLFFRKANFYIQLKAFTEAAADASKALGRLLAEKIPESSSTRTGFSFLPKEDRIPGSERFEPQDAVLGGGFLNNVFAAEYGEPGQSTELYVADCGDAATASKKLEKYSAHVKQQGETLGTEQIEGVNVTLMDLDGLYEGFFADGKVIGGVVGAKDQKTLRKYLGALIKSLQSGQVPSVAESGAAEMGEGE